MRRRHGPDTCSHTGIMTAFVNRLIEVGAHRRSVLNTGRARRCAVVSAWLVALAGACLVLPATAAATTI